MVLVLVMTDLLFSHNSTEFVPQLKVCMTCWFPPSRCHCIAAGSR